MLLSLGPLSSEPSCLRGKRVCRMGRQWTCSLFARVVFALGAPCLASLRAGDSCEGCYLMSHLRTTCCPVKTDQALCPHRLLQSGWKRFFRLAFPPGGIASSRLCSCGIAPPSLPSLAAALKCNRVRLAWGELEPRVVLHHEVQLCYLGASTHPWVSVGQQKPIS